MDRERKSSRHGAACALTFILLAAGAGAMSIERADARYADKQYQFELVAMLDAPLEHVQSVLRDYEHYPALDARILEARVLERPSEHVALLLTTLRMCFGPFCRNVRRVERVEEGPSTLSAIADPERSDVSSGETHTTLTAVGRGTQVTYRTAISPSFWIPAVIGRRWMLNKLNEATVELFRHVELRAQALDSAIAAPSLDRNDML
jgi:hypothetical protein